MSNKKFEWKPTECAPHHYPSRIYQGSFITNDDRYINIPNGGRTLKNGWGSSGSSWSVGDDLKSVPSHLKIIWISYTENQFYFLDTPLPKQKMIELFEKGFIDNTGTQDTYNRIIVGLAPGGIVSVWLMNSTRTTEIGHYQAIKTDVDIKDWVPGATISREEYVKRKQNRFSEETKQAIAEQGIPIGKWTRFRKRFLWKPVIKHRETFELISVANDFFNGERYSVAVDNPILDDYQNYPPPCEIGFYWYGKRNNEHGCIINFNEKEIWGAFEKLFEDKETKKVELVYKIDKYNSEIEIYLKSKNDSIRIEKAKIEVFHVSK